MVQMTILCCIKYLKQDKHIVAMLLKLTKHVIFFILCFFFSFLFYFLIVQKIIFSFKLFHLGPYLDVHWMSSKSFEAIIFR